MTIIATRGTQQLLDYGNGRGAIYDTETGLPGPEKNLLTLLNLGYWQMLPLNRGRVRTHTEDIAQDERER